MISMKMLWRRTKKGRCLEVWEGGYHSIQEARENIIENIIGVAWEGEELCGALQAIVRTLTVTA